MADELADIQQLQRHDLRQAEERTRRWLRETLALDVASVSLHPKPTSLNSFNGIAVVGGRELFFKSHTEPGGVVEEYYNSQVLADAGYNVMTPVLSEHRSGQQIVFYPVISWPVMFDLARQGEKERDALAEATAVTSAEAEECARLLRIYRETAQQVTAPDNAAAPVHQLFWHRLTGARFSDFYHGCSIRLPTGGSAAFDQIFGASWTINGVAQSRTLRSLVQEASRVLDPAQDALTVIGHGDAHYGNVFLEEDRRFLYFDPVFAGRHSPLLDVVKPLFHNVFAQWMYFPEEKSSEVAIDVRVEGDHITVDYAGAFTPLRAQLLSIKRETLLDPLLDWMKDLNALPNGTRPFELALMGCPLLTMNLSDADRFPAPISWLGFALALQMGNWDQQQDFGLQAA